MILSINLNRQPIIFRRIPFFNSKCEPILQRHRQFEWIQAIFLATTNQPSTTKGNVSKYKFDMLSLERPMPIEIDHVINQYTQKTILIDRHLERQGQMKYLCIICARNFERSFSTQIIWPETRTRQITYNFISAPKQNRESGQPKGIKICFLFLNLSRVYCAVSSLSIHI